MSQNRHPRGVPTGGQYAAATRSEAVLDLPRPAAPTADTEATGDAEQPTLHGAAEFTAWNRICTALSNDAAKAEDVQHVTTLDDGTRVGLVHRMTAAGDLDGTITVQRPDSTGYVREFDSHEQFLTARDEVARQIVIEQRDPFYAAEVISTYSRTQALDDGVLHDHAEMGRQAGFPAPVALTAAVQHDAVAWDERNAGAQDESGRAWDVLYMGALASRSHAMSQRGQLRVGERIPFTVYRVPNTRRSTTAKPITLHAVFGVDDHSQPCFTIMQPDED